MQHPLHNQHVVVIGGTSGIGAAVAVAARQAGCHVTIVGRSAQPIEGVAAVAADITDHVAMARALDSVATIDHLVVTAGARVGSPTLDKLDAEELQLAFDVKLFGALFAIQAALPHLARTASITLTSGVLARKASAGGLLKGTLNGAIEAAGRQLAKELAPLRVNLISPGVVDTDLWGAASDARAATMARIGASLPVGRVGHAEDLAQAYLAVMSNGFMTGAVIDVEGGALL
ncbi:MAG: SDR family oxidoreductase [Rhodocyclaceae bacterium]